MDWFSLLFYYALFFCPVPPWHMMCIWQEKCWQSLYTFNMDGEWLSVVAGLENPQPGKLHGQMFRWLVLHTKSNTAQLTPSAAGTRQNKDRIIQVHQVTLSKGKSIDRCCSWCIFSGFCGVFTFSNMVNWSWQWVVWVNP